MPAFQETQSLLPCSQEFVPCPSPDFDEFSLHLLILFLKIHFKIKRLGYWKDHPFPAGARDVSLFQNFDSNSVNHPGFFFEWAQRALCAVEQRVGVKLTSFLHLGRD
jgi:hypothetical protein